MLQLTDVWSSKIYRSCYVC